MDDFTFLTRIHYLAPSDGLWGEHEVDYILFCALDVTLDINPNEVSDAKYVSKEELEAMFADEGESCRLCTILRDSPVHLDAPLVPGKMCLGRISSIAHCPSVPPCKLPLTTSQLVHSLV